MIDLYALTSPNVQKVFIALEELQLPYRPIFVDVWKGEHFGDEFGRINPNRKIPAIVDHDGPGGKPQTVIESGAILMYLADKTGKLLPTDPIDGVAILQMDFMDDAAPGQLREALGSQADLVLSDMAANTVGHPQTDHLRTMALVEAGMLFATEVLRPGGAYVAKVLAGGADHNLVAELKRHFATVKHAKPPASRKGSSEWYVIAQGFKGAPA